MVKAHWSHGPYQTLALAEDKLSARVTHFLENQGPDFITILSCLEDGTPVGIIAAAAIVPDFSDERIATEFVWWVDPEYRRSKRAVELLNAYEYWAKNKAKCKLWHMALFETEDRDTIAKLYQRKHYVPTEQTFIKGV